MQPGSQFILDFLRDFDKESAHFSPITSHMDLLLHYFLSANTETLKHERMRDFIRGCYELNRKNDQNAEITTEDFVTRISILTRKLSRVFNNEYLEYFPVCL